MPMGKSGDSVYTRRYHHAHREECLSKLDKYRESHKDYFREMFAKWTKDNIAYKRFYDRNLKWLERHGFPSSLKVFMGDIGLFCNVIVLRDVDEYLDVISLKGV